MTDILQWLGCITGVGGSLLLALNTRASGWGFTLFLASNGFWIAFSVDTNTMGLLGMHLVFTATSIIGIYRWLLIQPPLIYDPKGDPTAKPP